MKLLTQGIGAISPSFEERRYRKEFKANAIAKVQLQYKERGNGGMPNLKEYYFLSVDPATMSGQVLIADMTTTPMTILETYEL